MSEENTITASTVEEAEIDDGIDIVEDLYVHDTDPEFFAESEVMGAHRFATRADVPAEAAPVEPVAEVAAEEEDDDEGEEDAPRRTPRIDSGWAATPSISSQAMRAPDTVRLAGLQSAVLNLSEPADLKRWNDILACTEGDSASMMITESERNFHNGTYVLFVTYGRLEYKRI